MRADVEHNRRRLLARTNRAVREQRLLAITRALERLLLFGWAS